MFAPACIKYDMTCTDDDHCWTICPELNQCCCAENCFETTQHVRAVIDELSDETCMPCDVILDSGADTMLPLCFGDLGEACAAPSSTDVDAQGCPLAVEPTRVATLQFGDIASKRNSSLLMSRPLWSLWAKPYVQDGILFRARLARVW